MRCRRLVTTSSFVCLPIGLALTGCASTADEPDGSSDAVAADSDAPRPTLSLGGTPLPGCPGDPPFLVADLDLRQVHEMDRPARREPFRDPVFGTCIVRVTDRESDLEPDDPSGGLKNEYSRVQSFNADGSLLLARSTEANWYLYNAATLQPLGMLPLVDEPRWDAVDPFVITHIDEVRLRSYDVQTGEERLVHDFSDDFPGQAVVAVWTRYEGSPSIDGRYWGLMAQNEEWLTIGFVVYDLLEDEVIATREVPPSEIDSVTISPLGNHFLAGYDAWCDEGHLGDDAHPGGLMVYDRDLQHGRGLLRIIGHSDTALDADGREVLVSPGIDTDYISMLDLETGEVTELWPIDFGHTPIGLHFSGRAFRRPGWALISTYSGGHPTSHTWMDNQVFAIELRPNGRVVRLAYTHSIADEDQDHDYWAEPQASANHDLTRIVFTSNWGRSGTDQVEMYLIDLPADWAER